MTQQGTLSFHFQSCYTRVFNVVSLNKATVDGFNNGSSLLSRSSRCHRDRNAPWFRYTDVLTYILSSNNAMVRATHTRINLDSSRLG